MVHCFYIDAVSRLFLLFSRIIKFAHANVCCITVLSCFLSCIKEFLCFCWLNLLKREVANFAVKEFLELIPLWCLRVELEWVLSLFCKTWVEAPQVPVSTFNSLSFLCLALTHASLSLETVVDTWSICNDERWSWVSFSFADSLQTLCIVCTHCITRLEHEEESDLT